MIGATALLVALQSGPVEPLNAVEAVIRAFEEVPLVALGERHETKEMWEFYSQLVAHPGFPSTVDDIVLEIFTARHQDLLDRFVEGQPVSLAEVRVVWRDATNSPLQTGDSPGMEGFLQEVRRRNQHLPTEQRIRVLAGDPPIDWNTVSGPQEFQQILGRRDIHFADTVVEQVLRTNRKALLIMGRSHLTRV